jgi:hypothetical protein
MRTRRNRALTMRAMGEREAAAAEFREVLRLQTDALGEHHDETEQTRRNLEETEQ